MSSDAQMLVAGVLAFASGTYLLVDPVAAMEFVAPACATIEEITGLLPMEVDGTGQALAMVGVLQLFLGFLFLWGVYTEDEKLKRNATPARAMLALACLHVCVQTDNGSSLVALLGITNALGAALTALAIGLGDGNQVDLDKKTN